MNPTNPFSLLGLLCTALLLLSSSRAGAQVANAKPPTQLTYQGFLTDANGVPFGNSAPVNKTVIFRIYDALTGGTVKWSSQQVVTVDKGYFSVLLGQGSAGPEGTALFNADLTGIFTGSSTVSDRYLELTADGTTIAPRLRFLPAPYALLAKSATDLVDPVTGASSLSISGGNLNVGGSLNVSTVTAAGFSGSGANLTALNGSQVTSGTLANARTTAASANTPSAIVARDASGNFSAGTITATAFSGGGGDLTGLNASQVTSGTLGNARTTATSANTANAIVARDASGNLAAGQVVANSFKLAGTTTTLVLYSLTRGPLGNPAAAGSGVKLNTYNYDCAPRQGGVPTEWYKSTSGYGGLNYAVSFSIPAGEVWEAAFTGNYYWRTDDAGAIVWTLDDALTDDGVGGLFGLPQIPIMFNQTMIMGAGDHVVRVKTIITGGSGDDRIIFPWHQPSHFVLRKYKSN